MKRVLLLISLLLVSGLAAEDALRLQNQQTFPAALSAGNKDVILQFDLYHTGKVTYTDINVTLKLPEQFESIKTTYSVDRILPGQTATVSFRFNVKSTIDPGTYTTPLAIAYTDTSGPYQTVSNRNIYLSVSSTPVLKFIDIEFTPSPHIGKEFDTIFTLNNTGALPASNIVATISTLAAAGITWIPDSQVVDYIAPNSPGAIAFKGRVSSETAPGAYPGTIALSYSGKTLTNAFILEVHGTPDLRLAGSQTDKTPYVGEKFTLSVQLEDVGKEKARSVQVKLNDEAIAGTLTSFIGTIDPDDTGSAIFDITLSKSGSYAVPLEYIYMDDEGNTYTQTENIALFIYTRPFDFTGIFLLAIIAVAVWYWMKGRKRKRRIDKIVD